MIDMITPWGHDHTAADPGARVRTVAVDGRLFTVRNVMGPGYSMVVRPTANPHFLSDMADWEDWDGVERVARRMVALEAYRAG